MNVLVAGCGYVGTELGLRLAAAGHRVWGLRRSPEELPAPIRPIAADLTRRAELTRLPDDLDAVVYAASADSGEPEAYRAAYVTGLENLLAALGPATARLVFVSSTAVYGGHAGAEVDDDTPPDPDGFRGEILREAELIARSWSGTGVAVRASGIYGPGRDRILRRAVETGGVLDGPDRWTNRIHRDDLAAALRHVLERDAPASVYLASDREPVRLSTLLEWLAGRLETSTATTGGATVDDTIAGKRCRPRRLLAEGFSFRFPTWREGYGSMLAGAAS